MAVKKVIQAKHKDSLQQERVNIKKAVKNFKIKKSELAEHCHITGHSISWDSAEILRTCSKWYERRSLEAWEINVCGEKAINRDDGLKLPNEYLNLTFKDKNN